jgi:hypothetical protein
MSPTSPALCGTVLPLVWISAHPGSSDALGGQPSEGWVDLDAQPVTAMLLGHETNGACSKEEIEY